MKKLFLLLFALIPTMMFADNITEDKAQAIAEQFFTSPRAMMSNGMNSVSLRMVWNGEDAMTRSENAPAFYVFNNEGGKGFVIVSGDDRTASQILGYSFDQNFDAESMPENLKNWMNGMRSEINEARANGIVSEPTAMFEHNDKTPIKLLQTALWDQRAPYNSELPVGYVTGCPATAIAIIMRYHEWPEKGVGTIPASNEQIGAVELGHVYDWKNMPLTYNDLPTEAQKKEVGILMRDVGAMVRTQYGSGSAGANPEETLPQLMPIYMRYNAKTIKSIFKRDFDEAEWHKIMQKELDEERPILYGGYSSGGGHQFVIDGYAADNFYHVNWGWSGVSNGYYLLSGMNPPEQGAGGSVSPDGFTKKQDAIIGIQPDPNEPGGGHFDQISYKGYVGKPYGISATTNEFVQGKEFSVSLKEIQNKGSRTFAGKTAVGHFAEDGTFKGIVSSKEIDYSVYTIEINDLTENSFKCTINENIAEGDFIAGVFKYQNPSEWTIIRNGYLENEMCTEKIMLTGGDAPAPVEKNHLKISILGKGGYITCDGVKITDLAQVDAEPNQTFKIMIYPEKGYELEKVNFNDINDVTAFARNNRYITQKITKNSTLTFSFKEAAVKQNNVNIIVEKGGKVIVNGEEVANDTKTAVVESCDVLEMAIVPDNGYQTKKIIFNGNDVTSDLEGEKYVTPAISRDVTIRISFSVSTGINDAQSDDVRAYGENGMIVVKAPENAVIDVYTLDGAKVASTVAAATTKIAVNGRLFIVRVNGKSFKVVL